MALSPAPDRTKYGIARNVYGRGMTVVDWFASYADAAARVAEFLPGTAVVTRFSDGRWRAVVAK